MPKNDHGSGPNKRNAFKDPDFGPETKDESPGLDKHQTASDQALDEGPSDKFRPIGHSTAKGRPPLLEK